MLPEIKCSTWVSLFFFFLFLKNSPQDALWLTPVLSGGQIRLAGAKQSSRSLMESVWLGSLLPTPSKADSVLCSTYLNVLVGYLFTPKFKPRNPSGKDERKGRRVAGQQKQSRRETCAQIARISTPHPLQGGGRFLNPKNLARVFLGKDWSLYSMFILDLFTLFPTLGAMSSPLPSLHSVNYQKREGKTHKWTAFARTTWKCQSLSKEGGFCPKAIGLLAH